MESKWTLRDQTKVGVVNNKQTILKRRLSTITRQTILEWGVVNNKQRPY